MPSDLRPVSTTNSTASRHSPCVGICDLDQATGWCRGCGRSRDEIARWIELSDAERLKVWEGLSARLDALGVGARLMPWTAEELADWVAQTFNEGNGTWVTGVPGAVAEFPLGAGRDVELELRDGALVAKAHDAQMRLELHDKLRAFAFGADGQAPVVLTLPKARINLRCELGLTHLGADEHAIAPGYRGDQLFDLGIGRRSSRFCVRTADEELIAALMQLAGAPLARVLKEAGALFLAKSPHRVVESALARIEVFARIPAPSETSPDGAHTHLLPGYLEAGEETPAALSLPQFALPVATFYPRPKT
jgi:predicted Fe-S protein YdhL (DUF1289 family)